ncbi:hypothetical protein SARC_07739 [Sphaeroforma arctica JP610]|uniref:SWIM-type domain-containing protein n=1 Tax=Sphaeroforma arctica JP610 TaxID=667725 RepID=A0A0L0FSX0_9EUKA|nr:hypothetical protein SARC_07739 [Sphaeroforma arctica JP610]KNC79885.1 hypothetical protein SARC_07739 [Sphaeroforma arctica JP610]|eukprot:XP_014153787.1 hypothetical protein SARC_07739 [Sphaeroforma arctica JP610]
MKMHLSDANREYDDDEMLKALKACLTSDNSGESNPIKKIPEVLEDFGVCPIPDGFRHTSQFQNLTQAYANIALNNEGKYYVKKGYCVCPLCIEGKCVHVAALIWSTAQQGARTRANKLEKYRHDSAVTKAPNGESDDENVVCTSRLGNWVIPSGNEKMDLRMDPHTIAERQDAFVQQSDEANTEPDIRKRKVREGLCQKQYLKECMKFSGSFIVCWDTGGVRSHAQQSYKADR